MSKFLVLCCLVGAVASLPQRGLIPRLDGRIVGGEETTIEQYPHQISLRYYSSHRCGGSIYKTNVIICAAHCTINIAPTNLKIRVGATHVSQGGDLFDISKIVEHEKYDGWEFDNDISIIFLEKGLNYGQSIQPIALASQNEELRAGTMVLITGWGTLASGGSAPTMLQVVKTTIVGHDECVAAYSEMNPVSESMLCAGEPNGGKDACQGDSGGPLFTNGKLYGIVSWGYGCAFPKYPGVYAKVSNLRKWVDQQLEKNGIMN